MKKYILLPLVGLLLSGCSFTSSSNSSSSSSSISTSIFEEAFSNKNNSLFVVIENTASESLLTVKAGDAYPNSMLGDIVISLEKALQQAEMYGHSTEREVAFLTVHSMHHLMGYDHVNSEEEEFKMRERQRVIMACLEARCEDIGLYLGKREN